MFEEEEVGCPYVSGVRLPVGSPLPPNDRCRNEIGGPVRSAILPNYSNQ